MLDWIFEAIVGWVSKTVTDLMDAVSGMFLGALGTDMTVMEEYFPFVTKAFTVMQYTAWAILFLITVWQLFRVFGGPVTEAENPWALLARSAVFALLIGYAKPIFLLALQIARAPYTALMELTMTAEDFTFAGVGQVLSNGLVSIVSIASVVGALLLIILEIALGWNYFKLLLETVERYVVVGVLCYTSPLAFCMGASKATNNVFRSWCRMIGSQLLLLVMNVWFLRAFNSSVGQYVGNGGALSNGMGSVFLWLFCALAFLKTAQKFDSYLASMGLNVAQTGSSMGMELLMAARVVSGLGSGVRNAGSMFKGGGATTSTASGSTTGGAPGGFLGSFANKFRGNSYVRDAVVNGGTRIGANGPVGFAARAFGGVAARNGATLDAHSIASVAAKSPVNSGNLGGEIADRSLGNYMPQLQGNKLTDTQISGGRISTNMVGPDGKVTAVEMYAADQFDKPDVPHTVVTAADGSQWYQMANGPEAGSFFETPGFTGSPTEADQVAAQFPDAPEGTTLRTVDGGILEATNDQGSSLWYSSAFYNEPDAPHETIQAADGVEWYAMQPNAAAPDFAPASTPTFTGDASEAVRVSEYFPGAAEGTTLRTVGEGVVEATTEDGTSMWYSGAYYNEPDAPHAVMQASDGSQWYAMQPNGGAPAIPAFTGDASEAVQVSEYFPGAAEGTTLRTVGDGVIQATTKQGSSLWYNSAYYNEPDAPHEILHASDGSDWYAMPQASGGYPGESYASGGSAPTIPTFTGSLAEAAQVSEYFPSAAEGTTLRTVGDGVVQATTEQGSSLWYNSAYYNEPAAPHEVVHSSDGSSWYAMQLNTVGPDFVPRYGSAADSAPARTQFPSASEDTTLRSVGMGVVEASSPQGNSLWYSSAYYNEPAAAHEVMQARDGTDWYALPPHQADSGAASMHKDDTPQGGFVGNGNAYGSSSEYAAPTRRDDAPQGSGVYTTPTPIQSDNSFEPAAPTPRDGYTPDSSGRAAFAYQLAQFQSFMPGYEERFLSVDGSSRNDGRIEVRHANGSATMFYDTTKYAAPRGNYKVYEDKNGSQWYAIPGQPAVERRPVYLNGKPIYDNGKLRTTTVESVRYAATPSRFTAPSKRKPTIKAPKRKR